MFFFGLFLSPLLGYLNEIAKELIDTWRKWPEAAAGGTAETKSEQEEWETIRWGEQINW